MICGSNNVAEHYGKRIKLLHGCPIEGWPNRTWPIQPISRFLPKRVGWPCPVRSALKRTPCRNLIIFLYNVLLCKYIISTTYQKIGDLFCPVIFLDFRSVLGPRASLSKIPNSLWTKFGNSVNSSFSGDSSSAQNFRKRETRVEASSWELRSSI